MEYAIEASNLYKSYGNVHALEDLTLNIERGKSFGFLGPNGAGKTTFVKIILDLIVADSGSSKIFGIDSSETASRDSGKTVAISLEDTQRKMVFLSRKSRHGIPPIR